MSNEPGTAAVLADLAMQLVEEPLTATTGLWPRAAAFLGRQSLEAAMDELWEEQAPSLAECPVRAQLLCLASYLDDEELARRLVHAYSALSRACHHHPYELSPTASELKGWLEAVEGLVGSTIDASPTTR